MLVQKVRPSIRLLCGGVGLVLLYVAVLEWKAGAPLADLTGWGVFAAMALVVAAVGMLEDDGAEPGSPRFHELADPARALSPEDLPARGPEAASVSRETREPRQGHPR